ncbi:MAG: NifU family protein [Fimbriimonadales bacterium]
MSAARANRRIQRIAGVELGTGAGMSFLRTIFRRQNDPEPEMGPLYEAVRDAIEEVQAYARSHGGEIQLVGVSEEGDVTVRFRGTCNGCPLSSLTLKTGIEDRLRVLVPGVRQVVQA